MSNTIYKTDKRYLVISKANPDFLSSDRLKDADYIPVSYVQIVNGDYDYVPGQHDLVVHDGAMTYPTNSGSQTRNFIKYFKSNNGATQSRLIFSIDYTGGNEDFLTNGNTGGTIDLNKIKFEFLIVRSDNRHYGWYNPFSDYNSPYGVANIDLTRNGITTIVECTLSITPRVNKNDLVLVKVQAGNEWSSKIKNIRIVNIQ